MLLASEEGQRDGRGETLLRSVSSRDAVAATPFIAAAPLGILPPSAFASISTNTSVGGDANGKVFPVFFFLRNKGNF